MEVEDNKNYIKHSLTFSISPTILLTVIFVVLKLFDVITWSWGWVLSPLWISTILAVITFLGMFIWAMVTLDKDDDKEATYYD
jgi:hypothetical protein